MNTTASAPAPNLIGEDAFWDEWEVVPTADGDPLRAFDDAKTHPINNVWTIVEGDSDTGAMYALPGFRVVNKIGYVVTKKAWTNDRCEALYMEGDQEGRDGMKEEPITLPQLPHIPTV